MEVTANIAEKVLLEKNLLNYCEHDILKTMYNNEDFCDMAFIVDSTQFPVNRAIFGAASSVFKSMLLGVFQDAQSKEIPIPNVSKESFECLVKYIYGFGIQIDSLKLKDILDLVKLSHCYDFQNLFAALKSYLSHLDLSTVEKIMFTSSSSVKMMNAAFTYNIDELYKKICVVVQSSNNSLTNFMNDSKFLSLSLPVLTDLIQSDYSIAEEIDILKAVMRWIEGNDVTNDDPDMGNDDIKDSGYEISLDSSTDHESDAVVFEDVKPNQISVQGLLEHIRPYRIALPLYLTFSNDPLFKMYGQTLLGPWEKSNDKPRIQLHHTRFTLKCENYQQKINNSHVYKQGEQCLFSSTQDVHNNRLTLQVVTSPSSKRKEIIKLLLDKICAKGIPEYVPSDTINYSLILKSFHPFINDHFIVDRGTWSFGSNQNPRTCSHCSPLPQSLVVSTTLSTRFLASHAEYVENNSFELEAVIEYTHSILKVQ